MMLKISLIMFSALLLSPSAEAICTLARGAPTPLAIPSQIIRIAADAPVDTSLPIAQFDSPTPGQNIGYDNCLAGTEYGKRTLNLIGQNAATKIFQTNIPGIGIKVLASNGSAFGNFPSTAGIVFPGGQSTGTFDYPGQSFYRIQFFKTGDNLRLSNPMGDTVLPPGQIAYNYLMTADPASFVMNLTIGEMKIISTPACTADSAKTVDFNDVTPSLLKNGVTRNLNFAIVCKSDYGSYSAKASIITATPSSDASYIRAKDAAGNQDRLGIKITDSAGKAMKVDGSTSEQKTSITSRGPADFAWNATLVASSQSAPTGGTLSAKAEIVFDIQ
ncbi:MAG: fimbrial protein [Serratia inhibens]|uniref:fimbrial protein n=1 Tax=Serratia inhibens TaxID=2338073 RepID=UPI003C7B6883